MENTRKARSRRGDSVTMVARPRRALDAYDIVGPLARNAMGDVLLARRRAPGSGPEVVVIKRLRPDQAQDPERVRMFADEAQITSRLDHLNAVRFVEGCATGPETFMALEYIRGATLTAVLKRARKLGLDLPPWMVAVIGADVAAGLHHVHSLADDRGNPMRVVHRDVSPGNVLVSVSGTAKIIDLGIAQLAGHMATESTRRVKGKLAYMAPEQAACKPVDHRADLFALGIVLWEALAGRRLFRAKTREQGIEALMSASIPPPSTFRPIPAELDAIVMRALERDPAARFGTAEEMSRALANVARAEGGYGRTHVAAFLSSLTSRDGQSGTASRLLRPVAPVPARRSLGDLVRPSVMAFVLATLVAASVVFVTGAVEARRTVLGATSAAGAGPSAAASIRSGAPVLEPLAPRASAHRRTPGARETRP